MNKDLCKVKFSRQKENKAIIMFIPIHDSLFAEKIKPIKIKQYMIEYHFKSSNRVSR